MQSQVPPQGVYMNAEQASLVTYAEVQEIDKKLSSGCYACYHCWTYVIAVLAFLTAIQSVMAVFTHPIFIVNIIDAIIEVAFAIGMQEVLKSKKVADAGAAWCLALTCSAFIGVVTFIQRDAFITLFGAQGAYGYFAGLAVYYGLVYILPAYQIKALVERREAAMAGASQYNA